MLKIMPISGQDVYFSIFADADINFQYLQMRMRMLKVANADIRGCG